MMKMKRQKCTSDLVWWKRNESTGAAVEMKVDDRNHAQLFFSPPQPCRLPLSCIGSILLLLIFVTPSIQFSIVPAPLLHFAKRHPQFRAIAEDSYKTSPSAVAAQKIGGLLSQPEFEYLSAIHETISILRKQIPSLLTVPLTEASASEVYANATLLTIGADDSVELASGREELISISNALVLALAASSRAASFFTSFAPTQTEDNNSFFPQVQSKIAILVDPVEAAPSVNNPLGIQVHWEANILPAAVSAAAGSTISSIRGISLLTLDPETTKISSHRIQKLYYNGAFRDPETVGQSLAALRQTVKGFQESLLWQPFLSPQRAPAQTPSILLSVFNEVRNEFVNQQQQQQLLEVEKNLMASPLYVCEVDFANATGINVTDTSAWVPIDEYHRSSPFSPLPGSRQWSEYKHMHQAAMYFLKTMIPALANADEHAGDFEIESVFASNCALATLDGSTLFRGGDKMSNFFKAIAFLRRRTFGSWAMQSASVTSWKMEENECFFSVSFNYTTNTNIAGSVTTSGTDVYTLSSKYCTTDSKAASAAPNILIKEIQQIHLSIGDKSSKADGIRFMRSIATAIESGRFRPQLFKDDSSFFTDLLLRATDGNRDTSSKLRNRTLPLRTDSAATTVYRVMEALHVDCQSLILPTNPENSPTVGIPAIDFMAPKVQLCGYLNEPLLSGKDNYRRNLGLFIASFRAALRSGRVVPERDPQVRVELTSNGSIRCSLILFLKILPAMPGLSELIVGTSASSGAFPLKIEIKSEYVLCNDTGFILQHRLLHSKVNGQLTPGDVISRWIRQLSGTKVNNEDEADDLLPVNWGQSLQEALKWLQSVRSFTE